MIKWYYLTNRSNNKRYREIKDRLLLEYTRDHPVGSKTKTKVSDVINNILFNCTRAIQQGENELMVVFNNNFFSTPIVVNGKECKLPISRTYFNKVTEFLISKDLITVRKGGKICWKEFITNHGEIKYSAEGRESSVLTISDELSAILENKNVEYRMENVILLRDSESNDITFNKGPVQNQIKMLWDFNDMIKESVFRDKNGDIINEPYLKRIYNEDFEHGGRFYIERGVIQTMPSRDRACITIDGEPTCEVDVKHMHPSILYADKGIKLTHDPYDFPFSYVMDQERLDSWRAKHGELNPTRNFRKMMMLISLNCSDDIQASSAMSQKLRDDKRMYGTKEEANMKYVGLNMVDVPGAIHNMKEHNIEIHEEFNAGVGLRLQYKDSKFMNKVLSMCMQEGVPCVPIHDAVLIKKKDVDMVKGIMTSSFELTFGSTDNLTLEVK